MSDDSFRRFSLDKHEVDPEVLNRIMSADGDENLGNWNGDSIHDLVKELDRIEEFADPNYANLPHQEHIPDDLRTPISVDFPIWTCDKSGICLTGKNADEIISSDEIRKNYQKKYGGVGKFKEKVLREIEERNERLRRK